MLLCIILDTNIAAKVNARDVRTVTLGGKQNGVRANYGRTIEKRPKQQVRKA